MSHMHRYLTPIEQLKLTNTIKFVNTPEAKRDYHVLEFLLQSGCRIGEFSRLTMGQAWEALRTSYLFIPKEHRKGGKRDHKVFITTALRLHLTALISISDSTESDQPLIAGRFGEPMTIRNYQKRFKYWGKQAGLAFDVSPHFCRHSLAMTIMAKSTAKDPRGIVQSALGHASIATTGIYTAASREEVEATLESLHGNGGQRTTLKALRRNHEQKGLV